ncbi:MAG: hypothetical protein CBC78_000740 [Candidatus Pelagibacter sp. TMED118]|nr:MAG: hypothetical protein CBC78_000740 [Candidatus Pelagibacter sp. TMED118]|tara:strand:+ start:97 stop:1239 length:1143 start_codon:yes stop_codon:yes gene_type:complete
MHKALPYGKQFIDSNDINEVVRTLKKDKITTGPLVLSFEKKIKNFLKCKFALVCNSGTSAIYLAFKAIKVKKGDIIIMPTVNFISSYNVSKSFGAKIYLADVDKFTGQISPKSVEDCCKKFKLKKVKAIILMYNGGYPYFSDQFLKLKKKYNCKIIEDACHAFGAEYKSKNNKFKIGSCKHSDVCTFSFHPVKTITTGEGGAISTNSRELYDKMRLFRSHGIERKKNQHWKYNINNSGLNFRLTDFQCALGISQLSKVNKFLTKRKKIALIYRKKLKELKQIEIINHNANYISSNHLFLMHIKNFSLEKKNKFIKYMLKNKIVLQYHYIPIYKFKVYRGNHIKKNSETYYKNTVSLPIYYSLSANDQNYIVKKIKSFFNK